MMRHVFFILIAVFFFASTSASFAQDQGFNAWLSSFKQEAADLGISQRTLDDAFAATAPDETVLELDRKQPEGRLSLREYLQKQLTKKRFRDAQAKYDEHRELLQRIGDKYHVQPRFIVALWGVETDFGRNTGNFSVVDSLATLAFDGRRSAFFRGELLDALRILEAESMSTDQLEGSWAGALGQCQFMPSTYLKYAVDENKDGRRDVWGTQADVFASVANYLASLGWNDAEGWGRPVLVPKGADESLFTLESTKPLSQWQALGIRKIDGSNLPEAAVSASLIRVGEGEDAPAYLIYGNYKALLQWNRSRYFATSVGMLADAIRP